MSIGQPGKKSWLLSSFNPFPSHKRKAPTIAENKSEVGKLESKMLRQQRQDEFVQMQQNHPSGDPETSEALDTLFSDNFERDADSVKKVKNWDNQGSYDPQALGKMTHPTNRERNQSLRGPAAAEEVPEGAETIQFWDEKNFLDADARVPAKTHEEAMAQPVLEEIEEEAEEIPIAHLAEPAGALSGESSEEIFNIDLGDKPKASTAPKIPVVQAPQKKKEKAGNLTHALQKHGSTSKIPVVLAPQRNVRSAVPVSKIPVVQARPITEAEFANLHNIPMATPAAPVFKVQARPMNEAEFANRHNMPMATKVD